LTPIEQKISDYLNQENVGWKLDNGKEIDPLPKDVKSFLDKAVADLYDGSTGDLVVGAGLIVYKTQTGYDIYVIAGTY